MPADQSKYNAFISYSHAVDGKLAPKLYDALTAFAKPWYRRRAVRLFRDETSLSATPHLWPTIEAALNRSEFFILLASPGAAGSHWVVKELETFTARAGSERFLIALTDGDLRWDASSGDFDWQITNAFPRLSRPVFSTEPKWVDLRALRRADNLNLRNPDFSHAVASLSSALRGIPLDDLVSDDARLHRQTRRVVAGVVTVLLAFAIGLGIAGLYSYRKGREAVNAGLAAQAAAARTRSEFMVSSASSLEARDPLTAALVLSELDDGYQSERGVRLLRQLANELPIAVLPGTEPRPSGDHTRVLTQSGGPGVFVWNAETLVKAKEFKGGGNRVIDAALDGKGLRAAIAGDDHTVTVWDVEHNRQLRVLHDYNYRYDLIDASTVALSPDGEYVAFLSGNGARVAKADGTQAPAALIGHQSDTLSIEFSADSRHLVTTSLDRTTRTWSVDGRPEDVFRIDRSHPNLAMFSPDGRSVLTHDDNGTVRLWKRSVADSPVVFDTGDYTVYTVAFSPDGRTVAAGTKQNALLIWDIGVPRRRPDVLRGHSGWIRTVSFSPDGSRIVSGSDDGTVRIWAMDSDESIPIKVRDGLVMRAFFSANGRRLFSDGVGTYVWSPTGEEGEATVLRGHQKGVLTVDFSPDGQRFVTASEDGTARVWSTSGSGTHLILRGHTAAVRSASFSADGRGILTASDDGSARIWRLDGQGAPIVLRPPPNKLTHADRTGDGKRVVTSGAGIAQVWKLDAPSSPVTLQNGQEAERAIFSPDGSRILTISKQSAFLWSADGSATAIELSTNGRGRVADAKFSPDSSKVVGYSAGLSGNNAVIVWRSDGSGRPTVLPIREALWDVEFSPDGQRVLVLTTLRAFIWPTSGEGDSLTLERTGTGWLRKGAFSADGGYVAAISSESALVWRTDGPGAPEVLAGHRGLIEDLAFSPDGRRVATVSSDGTARLWSIDWPSLMKHVRGRVRGWPVCLTQEERIQYLGEDAAVARRLADKCLDPASHDAATR